LRTTKRILRQIKEWKDIPMMISGVYRLFTYIPWESIPEEYKQFFNADAEKDWNTDLDAFKEKNIALDVNAEIKAILRGMVKKNITHSLGLIPITLADIFMCGINVGRFQGELSKIISDFSKNIEIDRALAEQLALLSTIELLKKMIDSVDISLSFDIDEVTEKLIKEYTKNLEDATNEILTELKENSEKGAS